MRLTVRAKLHCEPSDYQIGDDCSAFVEIDLEVVEAGRLIHGLGQYQGLVSLAEIRNSDPPKGWARDSIGRYQCPKHNKK